MDTGPVPVPDLTKLHRERGQPQVVCLVWFLAACYITTLQLLSCCYFCCHGSNLTMRFSPPDCCVLAWFCGHNLNESTRCRLCARAANPPTPASPICDSAALCGPVLVAGNQPASGSAQVIHAYICLETEAVARGSVHCLHHFVVL